jgi:SAM-dependent methyltransferase
VMERLGDVLRAVCREIRGRLNTALIDTPRGIDTERMVPLLELGLDREDRIDYQASDWVVLRKALRRIRVRPDDVFLDLGSGKGRVVLEAARYPFKRVVGVELSPELGAIARANLDESRPRLRCRSVELVESDISDFPIPDDVTVVYAFNPFLGEPFEAGMRALIESYDRAPRRMRLIYVNPREHERLVDSGRFRLTTRFWRWRPRPAWMRGPAIHVYEIQPGIEKGSC